MTNQIVRREGGARIDGDQEKTAGFAGPRERSTRRASFRWRGRDAIPDLARSVEDFRDFIAQRTAELACTPAARGQFDQAVARMAWWTDRVILSHGMIMRDGDDCSDITVPTQRAVVRETYSDGTLFSFGELRIRNKCNRIQRATRAAQTASFATGVRYFSEGYCSWFAIRAGDYQPTRERRVRSG